MRLRRSVVSGPGLHRVRRGRGFSYHDHDGEAVADETTLTRIRDLVIPPAWKKVWISPHPNGHIQAVGTDVAGRRQYLYHEQWLVIDDPKVVRSVRSLLRRPDRTDRLLVCRNSSDWIDIHAEDLNARFKELVGTEYTVKDLRTWHGTVLAAAAFVDADPPVNKTVIKRVESAVMKEVAEELGNTPAVARGSYVDPRVVDGYEKSITIAAGVRCANRIKKPRERQAILENSTARLIRKVAKG